ncbi:MAG: hypothetical protein HUU47_10910 [Bacteroidetes bacterium]|nr:hypothetical protein [Bacteroidota bacterium]
MKKLITILMFLAFLTLSKNVVAQCFEYNWSNTSDCDWQVDFWDNSSPPALIAAASFIATAGTPGPISYLGPCGIGCGTTISTISFVNSLGCVISFPFIAGTQTQTNITNYCGAACGGALTTTNTISVTISSTTSGICTPSSNWIVSISITP